MTEIRKNYKCTTFISARDLTEIRKNYEGTTFSARDRKRNEKVYEGSTFISGRDLIRLELWGDHLWAQGKIIPKTVAVRLKIVIANYSTIKTDTQCLERTHNVDWIESVELSSLLSFCFAETCFLYADHLSNLFLLLFNFCLPLLCHFRHSRRMHHRVLLTLLAWVSFP